MLSVRIPLDNPTPHKPVFASPARFALVFGSLVFCAPLSGCVISVSPDATMFLTVENQTGADLWYFQYATCGSDLWTEVIAADEYVPDGYAVSSVDLYADCYDVYVEDEYGCAAQTSTGAYLEGSAEFVWTVVPADLYCP